MNQYKWKDDGQNFDPVMYMKASSCIYQTRGNVEKGGHNYPQSPLHVNDKLDPCSCRYVTEPLTMNQYKWKDDGQNFDPVMYHEDCRPSFTRLSKVHIIL